MAGIIAVDAVVAGIVVAITEVVAEGCESAVIASVTALVDVAVTDAIESAIAAAIASSVASDIDIVKIQFKVEDALQKNLNQKVKDVIGSQGISDLSKAMSALPTEVAVDNLAKTALDELHHHLWVLRDPAFFRLTRLVRAVRAVNKGEKPDYDDDDDDCDDEKCRFFNGEEVENNLEDFIFFSVFGSEECKKGDEVYSMSAQWKTLKAMVEDPIGGNFVSQLFTEIFDSCVDDDSDEEEERDSSVLAAVKPTGKGTKPLNKVKKKTSKVKYGKMVNFGSKKVYNIHGSSADKRKSNWLDAYFAAAKGFAKCGKCYIQTEIPPCGHTNNLPGNNLQGYIVGGHMWSPALKKTDKSLYYYILPICKRHNKHITYDGPPYGTGWLKTTLDARALKITSTSEVPGWKDMKKKMKGFKSITLMESKGAAGEFEAGKAEAKESEAKEGETKGKDWDFLEFVPPEERTNWLQEKVHKVAKVVMAPIATVSVFKEVSATEMGGLKDIVKGRKKPMKGFKTIVLPELKGEAGEGEAGKDEAKESEAKKGEGGECHEVVPPEELTKWLLEEVHKIALEFAKDPITTAFKEVSATVMEKLKDIIKAAGDETVSWAKSEGNSIMLQSLIPFYGIYKAIKRLNSLNSDATGSTARPNHNWLTTERSVKVMQSRLAGNNS